MFSGEIPNKRAPRFQPVWITVSNWQALVIQKVDNAVHCLSHYPADNAVGIHNTYPHWIVIYPVDCAIEHLINRGQNYNVNVNSSVFTREISMKFFTQLRLKKSTHTHTRTPLPVYWSIHELTVILPPRTMYD